MNAELKSPLLVIGLAFLAWGGLNLAGTVLERRGKEESERRLASLTREKEEAEKLAALKNSKPKAVLIRPAVEAPVEVAAADEPRSDAPAALPLVAEETTAKVGSIDAPVP